LAKHRAQRPYERKLEQLTQFNKPKMAALLVVPPLLLGTASSSAIEEIKPTPIVQQIEESVDNESLNTQLVALDTSTPDMYDKSERRRAYALQQMNAADAGLRIQAQEAQAAQERIDAQKAEEARIIAEQAAAEQKRIDDEAKRVAQEKAAKEQAIKVKVEEKPQVQLTKAEKSQADKVPDQELSATESQKVSEAVGSASNSNVFDIAEKYIGIKYRYGGTDPDTGLDCSAYVRLVYKQLGVSLPRTSAEQAKRGIAVSADEARPGDLVFFGSQVHHVGIYAGNGKMIDARKTGTVIDYRDMWYTERIQYRRVL